MLLSGKNEGIPYSLSRWTDVPAAKWSWFRESLQAGMMWGIDPRTGVPCRWSLAPEDALGLVFWTKDPTNLLVDRELLRGYQTQVHVTLTGWTEVEKGAPGIEDGARLLNETIEAFGVDNVTWRFSPIPLLPDAEVLDRFAQIVSLVNHHEVFVSFLQENDLMPETRSLEARHDLLREMAIKAIEFGDWDVVLCNEDQTPVPAQNPPGFKEPINLSRGVCAPGFKGVSSGPVQVEGCGCVLMADPFTINESCTLGCEYCYAADKSLSSKKRNTTKGRRLEVIR